MQESAVINVLKKDLNFDDSSIEKLKRFVKLVLSENKNHNLMANLEKGMFSTHRIFYDPRTSTFTPQQSGTFRITESSKNMNNLGEKYKTSLKLF